MTEQPRTARNGSIGFAHRNRASLFRLSNQDVPHGAHR